MFKISTKKDKGSAAVNTTITVVYDDADAERALATSALVVKWQGTVRKGDIPAAVTLKMSDYRPGSRHSAPVDPIAAAKAMTPDERAKLIAQLLAMK